MGAPTQPPNPFQENSFFQVHSYGSGQVSSMKMEPSASVPPLGRESEALWAPLLTSLQFNDMQTGGTLPVKWGLVPLFLPASQAAFSAPVLAARTAVRGWWERWATGRLPGNRRGSQGPQVVDGPLWPHHGSGDSSPAQGAKSLPKTWGSVTLIKGILWAAVSSPLKWGRCSSNSVSHQEGGSLKASPALPRSPGSSVL